MLKIKLLVVVAFLFASFSSFAQGVFAVKAGINRVKLEQSGTVTARSRSKSDFHLGGLYRYRYQKFVIQPELLYSQKGGTLRDNTTGEVTRPSFSYLSAPVLLGYIPTEGLTVQAGPEFSYALNTKSTNGPGSNYDLGVAVGVHYDFLDMLEQFSLHVRYVYGLNNVSNVPTVNYYNRTIQLSMVYNFYKKK